MPKQVVLAWEQDSLVEIEIPRKERRQVKGLIEVFNKHLAPAIAAIAIEVKKRQAVNPKVIQTRAIELRYVNKAVTNGGRDFNVFVLTQKVGVVDEEKTQKLWIERGWSNEEKL